MKLEKNSEIFKSISYRYKFLVGARDPNTLFRAKYELCCLSIEFMCNHSQNSLNRLNSVF